MQEPVLFPALVALMSEISEREWSAGWLMGLEDRLWDEVSGATPARRCTEGEIAALRELSRLIDGWAYWNDEIDKPSYAPMIQWRNRNNG